MELEEEGTEEGAEEGLTFRLPMLQGFSLNLFPQQKGKKTQMGFLYHARWNCDHITPPPYMFWEQMKWHHL